MLLRRVAVGCVFILGGFASMATSPNEEDLCETAVDDQRCAAACDDFVTALREPLPPPGPTTGRCVRLYDQVGCGCFVDDDRDPALLTGDDLRSPDDLFVDDTSCPATDRLGDCLVSPEDFPGCTIDDDASDAICDELCADIDARRVAAAAAVLDAVVDEAACDLSCSCRVTTDERCVVVRGVVPFAPGEERCVSFVPCDGAP